jgi:hypothetical protein
MTTKSTRKAAATAEPTRTTQAARGDSDVTPSPSSPVAAPAKRRKRASRKPVTAGEPRGAVQTREGQARGPRTIGIATDDGGRPLTDDGGRPLLVTEAAVPAIERELEAAEGDQ